LRLTIKEQPADPGLPGKMLVKFYMRV